MYCRECGSKIDEKKQFFVLNAEQKLTLVQPQNQNAAEPEKLPEKETGFYGCFKANGNFPCSRCRHAMAVFMEDKNSAGTHDAGADQKRKTPKHQKKSRKPGRDSLKAALP